MMRLSFDPRRASAALALGLVSLATSPSFAQGDPAGDIADKPAEAEETSPPPEKEADKPAEPEAEPKVAPSAEKNRDPGEPQPKTRTRDTAVAAVGVEHLGGDAYPEPTTRGIHGGSLWLTMHGLQWPYMPMIAGEPAARLGLSGSAWVDMSYARTDSGRPETEYNKIVWEQQSRFVLRATPTYSNGQGWFVQGQGELVLNGAAPALDSNSFATDDLYVRVGKWNLADLTFGRFQGWEIYHMGLALDLNTYERVGPVVGNTGPSPAQVYGVTHFWDRANGPGNVALHLYGPRPIEFLRAELLGQMGNSSGNVRLAGRATLIADWGMDLPGDKGYRIAVKAKLGGEYGDDRRTEWDETYEHRIPTYRDQTIRQGLGGSLQFVFDPYVELGGSVAQGLLDSFDQTGQLRYSASNTTTSVGGFLNVQPINRLIVGIGYHTTTQEALVCTETDPPVPPATEPTTEDCSEAPTTDGKFDNWKLTQYFAAIQYEPLPNFFAKLVLAHGKAEYNRYSEEIPSYTDETGELFGLPIDANARLRVMYLF